MNVQTVATWMREHGETVKSTSEPEEDVDGAVNLEGDVEVQVGCNYLCVNLWVEDEQAMYSGPQRRVLYETLVDIHAARSRQGRFKRA